MTSLLAVLTLLAVLSGGFCQNRLYRSVLSVTNGGQWGDWYNVEMCPENYYAIGFSLRVEGGQGDGDDTALNGIRLYCAAENRHGFVHTVESNSGFWGGWTSAQYCDGGVLTAFQLRVEAPVGGGDDTAANNIRFRCSSNPTLEGQGMGWGDYGGWSETCTNGGICGIKTKVEGRQGGGDDTALNDVRFYCCDRKMNNK
ncbi:vitelline membrane outer layer protein 1 homolog [Cheilinus undulatus]|uniref:vitelline membrane outer layer protein 1 homolog n=1 Tax=Cheilinus undulatus TaxID=241271 RepID=UPI001BD62D94|nr:vitelline membrane outer layer protein 1 homolog [Cheilinus undulatus]